MAFQAGGVVEIRSTGAADNGAYYDVTLVNHGTDYSQSDNPILHITDGACANNTTLTSVTGGFTAAMIANGVHIAGTNFTTGFYVITAVASSNSCTLDRNPTTGANASAGVCNVGGACTTLEAPLSTTMVTNNLAYVKKGTYSWGTLTLPASSTARAGIVGYKTTRGDDPVGADRPTITMSGAFNFGNGNICKNLIFTGSFNGSLLFGGTSVWVDNVKATLTGGTSVGAINLSNNSAVTRCEVANAASAGYGIVGQSTLIESCYVHDCFNGIVPQLAGCVISNTIVDTCTNGISSTVASVRVIGCTVYNCTLGVSLTSTAEMIYNTIIKGCTTGAAGSGGFIVGYINDFNVYDNTTDTSGTNLFPKDSHCITSNPLLIDPANGDFRLAAGSPAANAAAQVGVNNGAVGAYNLSIGVYQSAGSGGIGAFVG